MNEINKQLNAYTKTQTQTLLAGKAAIDHVHTHAEITDSDVGDDHTQYIINVPTDVDRNAIRQTSDIPLLKLSGDPLEYVEPLLVINDVNVGPTISMYSAGFMEVKQYISLTDPEAVSANTLTIKATTASSSNYAIELMSSSATRLFSIRNNGYMQIATSAGAPTGAYANGTMVFDTTNNRLYVYKTPTWRYVALT